MQKLVVTAFWRPVRVLSLIFLAVLGTVALMRFAPGYFSDAREMDAPYASKARTELAERRSNEATFTVSASHVLHDWLRGGLGTSRQYGVPVLQLVRERLPLTAKLITQALIFGWLSSFSIALPLSARRRRFGESAIALTSASLLCVPVALMATLCLVLNVGGPVLVLGAVIAVRDFKLIYRMLRGALKAPHFVYARSQGFTFARSVRVHLFRALGQELIALLMTSLVVALSAAVPVEVIFDQPGLGQLAWSAAMNRDLPTLVAVTLLMASLVGLASLFSDAQAPQEASACA